MSLIGNIIWLIFGGLLTSLGYILGGIGLCLRLARTSEGLYLSHFQPVLRP